MLMARMLPKNIHGQFAIINVFITIFSIFGQVGVSSALIQKQSVSDSDINYSFWATFAISLGVFATVAACAVPLSNFYYGKVNAFQITIASFSVVLSSITLVPVALLQRDFQYKKIMFINATALLIGYVIAGPLLAVFLPNVWALILVTVLHAGTLAIAAYVARPIQLSSPRRDHQNKEILHFGLNLSIVRLLSYLPSQIDKLIIGRLSSENFLGVWTRGQFISLVPGKYFGGLFDGVLFSYFSRLQAQPNTLQRAYIQLLSLLTMSLMLIAVFCAVYAREVVLIFLGPNWSEAEPIVLVLSVAIPLSIMARTTDVIARSSSSLRPSRIVKLSYLLLIAMGAVIGGLKQDFVWLATLQLISITIYVALMVRVSCKLLNASYRLVIARLADALPIAFATLILSWAVKAACMSILGAGSASLISFIISIVLLVLLVFLWPGILGRENILFLRKLAEDMPANKAMRPIKKSMSLLLGRYHY